MSSRYSSYRNNKIQSGLLYQDFVVDLCWQTIGLAIVQYASKVYQQGVGESRTGVEIKHDEAFKRTGSLWIECAEKAEPRPGPYILSGIYRTDNAWLYVIGDYDTVFIFPKKLLQQLHSVTEFRNSFEVKNIKTGVLGQLGGIENNTSTSIGFLLNRSRAQAHASVILTPNKQQQVSKLTIDVENWGRELHALAKADPNQYSLFREGDV